MWTASVTCKIMIRYTLANQHSAASPVRRLRTRPLSAVSESARRFLLVIRPGKPWRIRRCDTSQAVPSAPSHGRSKRSLSSARFPRDSCGASLQTLAPHTDCALIALHPQFIIHLPSPRTASSSNYLALSIMYHSRVFYLLRHVILDFVFLAHHPTSSFVYNGR